ncbi:MAG: [Fe-Fe] hydrogenase large subunit C-terminal domain-containing protein [Bacillota bacterium]|nr:[Fe-Fe] hydrogenase large subunit C-terminal domain-containing protein [Bacillota bacterium]
MEVQNSPELQERKENVIRTVAASCQDCYRCVRACPVKAIRITEGQARVEDKLCIQCGNCVRECPQHAKVIVSSLWTVKDMLAAREQVAVSLAPSFAGYYSGWSSLRLPSALRRLGFAYIAETAEGARLVAEKSLESLSQGNVCTACPVVVNYVEKYRPELVDLLIPVVSPMVAHGRLMKKRLGENWKVVFIGPCAAKKEEAQWPENRDAIDAVLTFAELADWLEEEGIELANCTESGFDNLGDYENARLFPVQGGMLKTCGRPADGTNREVIHFSGPQEVMRFFDLPKSEIRFTLAEPLFCPEGCINGPAFPEDVNAFLKKQAVIDYAATAISVKNSRNDEDIDFRPRFAQDSVEDEEIDESRIQQVLESTGKGTPEMQLNCGACGYASCREKAIAVVKGMAEPEMCMPYMRRVAQQRTDKIIETIPTGVVILDRDFNMLHMNPAFQKMFSCNNGILGRRISYLVSSDGFEKVAAGETEQYESIQSKYGIRYHEVIYALPEEEQYVGIYTDISNVRFDASQIDILKRQTLEHAKELLAHQIRFSQEMSHYLGRNTAQSEDLVRRITDLYEENETEDGR